MSEVHHSDPAEPEVGTTPPDRSTTETAKRHRSVKPAHTRISAAWVGVCLGALLLVVLIIFLAQNTRSVTVTFLWMEGSIPLALALLIAAVGVGCLMLLVGAARITQLRLHARKRQH